MGDLFDEMVAALRELTAVIAASCDAADARMRGVNGLLARVAEYVCLNETEVLGSVVYFRPYGPPRGDWDVGEAMQAALRVPGGIGVVVWDAEELLEARAAGERPEGGWRFRPYEACEPAVRASLLPHLEPLLARVFRHLPHPKKLVARAGGRAAEGEAGRGTANGTP